MKKATPYPEVAKSKTRIVSVYAGNIVYTSIDTAFGCSPKSCIHGKTINTTHLRQLRHELFTVKLNDTR